ncbi:unnamed protein product [Ectocarpus fasciculatus]
MLLPGRADGWVNRQQHGHQQGRRSQAIINTNLKTELCRNHTKGFCTYGDRCAFAHGREELKYRTLREMQNAGRIPDAVKYRCIPCMTWVATGSCPYSSRCVFIHDPRVQGRQEAWLYAGSHMSSAYHSSDSAFFFPDLPRDPDSLLPRDSSLYDLDPAMCAAKDRADRAVYNMWYSFVSVLTDIETDKKALPSGGASAKPGAADVFPAPSPSSSDSTLALSDRSSSFGSDYSTSPTDGGGGGSAFAAGGFRASRTVASTGGGSGEQAAILDQHQAAERRIAYGGCPRLPSFVDLGRGVPTAPTTPTSPDTNVAGFPFEDSHLVAFSRGVTPGSGASRSYHPRSVEEEVSPASAAAAGGGSGGRGGSPGFSMPADYPSSPPKSRSGGRPTLRSSVSIADCSSSASCTSSTRGALPAALPRPCPSHRRPVVSTQVDANGNIVAAVARLSPPHVVAPRTASDSIDCSHQHYQRHCSPPARRVPFKTAPIPPHAAIPPRSEYPQPQPQPRRSSPPPAAAFAKQLAEEAEAEAVWLRLACPDRRDAPPPRGHHHHPYTERVRMWAALDHQRSCASSHNNNRKAPFPRMT